MEKVKELVHEGNVRRIIIKDSDGKTVMEIPVTVGVVGFLVAPALAAIGAVAALAAGCGRLTCHATYVATAVNTRRARPRETQVLRGVAHQPEGFRSVPHWSSNDDLDRYQIVTCRQVVGGDGLRSTNDSSRTGVNICIFEDRRPGWIEQ